MSEWVSEYEVGRKFDFSYSLSLSLHLSLSCYTGATHTVPLSQHYIAGATGSFRYTHVYMYYNMYYNMYMQFMTSGIVYICIYMHAI